jgi:Protein of unknown function (DUF2914)
VIASRYFKIEKKSSEQSWKQYYEHHEFQFGALAFIGGFLWDVFTQSNVDDPFSLGQQIVYLIFIGVVLALEIRESLMGWKPGPKLAKIWTYREFIEHFFLGSLLSVYSLFYFKSASLSSSFLFLLFMLGLMLANEFPYFQSRGPLIRLALWTLCLASFFMIAYPLMLGFVGLIPILLALSSAAVIVSFFWWPYRDQKLSWSKRALFAPSYGVLVLFLLAYLFRLTPPVPLALNSIGIYHQIEKSGSEYILTAEKPWWRFWHTGDQLFIAKPGDKVFVFMEIFSPTAIKETVNIRWARYDAKLGWGSSDVIPMKINGGRIEGYRGFTFKANYTPGLWRVYVETSDGLEIGRISLNIEASGS